MINVLALLTAALAVFVAAAVYIGESRRTDLEAARQLHSDLTSGEVAGARRLLGTLRYGSVAEKAAVVTGEALTAYFTLLWCFERITAGRRAMLADRLTRRRGRAVVFLDDVTTWHLVEWREGLPAAKEQLNTRLDTPVDDGQSCIAFQELLAARGLGRMRDV